MKFAGRPAASPARRGPARGSGGKLLSLSALVGAAALLSGLLIWVAIDDRSPAGTKDAAQCEQPVEVVVWTGSHWQALARALADQAFPCAHYYISIPPPAGSKTELRPAEVYDRIRRLGRRIHPLAEVTLGQTGWAKWVAEGNGSWYDAGVEFRRRMAAAGLESARGETWLINEFDRTTRLDTTERLAVEIARNVTRPYPRQAMRDLVRGLYDGAVGMAPLPGAAEIGINFSHQNLPDVPSYKRQVMAWLEDSSFWRDLRGRVRWLLREVYPDTRFHSVPGSTLDERSRHLEAYQEHFLTLVEGAPESVETAISFLRTTYVPLFNAGYVALGGDRFDFVSAHGNTEVSPLQMMNFVSEQVYTIRYYALRHPGEAPGGRIGFSWDPIDRFGVGRVQFAKQIAALGQRLALSIRGSYRPGASADGACVSAETHRNWCQASRPGARFTDAWDIFKSWGG